MLRVHTPTVALLGNPNTGKTTLFNALAGMNQRVGNYPGVTVETKKGKLRHGGRTFDLVDLPGTYSLAPRSPDEMVAVDLILGQQAGEARPDVVVTIVDASNLERNLYLTTQALELGVPVVVALNMVDVARAQGITVDATRLGQQLGVPVVPIQANRRVGLDALKQAIAAATGQGPPGKLPTFPEPFEREVDTLRLSLDAAVPPFLLRRLLLDVGGYTERRIGHSNGDGATLATHIQAARQRLTEQGCGVPAVEARVRYGWIRTAVAGCVQRPQVRPVTWTDKLDRVLTHKVWGTLIFLALMFVVFQSIFTLARPLMDLIQQGQNLLADWVQGLMAPGPLRSLLTDGVIKGVGSVLAFLPQIAILFAFIAVLEDCGYMARAAFLMDKLMARAGLSGKSFIPLLSSVACAVPGIMAARVIENRRDRLATMVVAPLMSCSARLPVYMLLIGAFLSDPWWLPGVVMFGLYALGLVLAPLVACLLKSTLLRGETPVFVLEMPLYKWPALRTVGRRVFDSGWMFVRRAGTVILATMIVVWALLYFPHTDAAGNSYDELAAALEATTFTHDDREFTLNELRDERKAVLDKLEKDENDAEAKQDLAEINALLNPVEKKLNGLRRDQASRSMLGQAGHAIEPAVRPLGWDWRIGVAAIASFPAREVMVGTLGLLFSQGKGASDDERYRKSLGDRLQAEHWEDEPGRPLFTVPVALSVLVFFALCCQCGSTLAVIGRETKTWRWPAFTFVYMTTLAYVGALVVYQVGSLF
jgi:ferrous iron transport protein B